MAGSTIIFVIVALGLGVSGDALTSRDNGVPGGAIGATECKKANSTVWHLPYPRDCTKFIKCHISANKSTIYTCDTPLHFNPTIQTCDWPQNAGCNGNGDGNGSGSSTTTTAGGSGSTPTTPAPAEDIGARECKKATSQVWHLPYPGDCTKFIKCDILGNKSTIYTCDKPLHFNPTIQTCDWPQNAGCDPGVSPTSIPSENNSTTTTTTTTTTSSPSEFDRMCSSATSDRWHLPYPGNCSKFIKCDLVQGTWHIFDCPPPLHFNPAIQVCDWPNNAGCDIGSTSTPTTPGSCSSSTTPSTTTPTECVTKPVDPPECTSPKPNPSTPGPLPPTPTPSTGGNKCPAPFGPGDICRVATDHHWHLPHPTDTTKFYKCEINSCRAFLFDCPDGLVFNPPIQVCDWPKSRIYYK